MWASGRRFAIPLLALLAVAGCDRDRSLTTGNGTDAGAVVSGDDGGATAQTDGGTDGGDNVFRGTHVTFAIGDGVDVPGTRPWALAAGDFNGDKRADLIVGSNSELLMPDRIDLALGTAAASVTPAGQVEIRGPADLFFNGLVTGDFDGDGKLDAVLDFESALHLLSGDGQGGVVDRDLGMRAHPLVGGDFNGDGRPDLADDERVLLSDGHGGFTSVPIRTPGGGAFPVDRLASADLDGDGALDLVGVGSANHQLFLYRGRKDAVLSFQLSNYVADSFRVTSSLVLADVNQDGRSDALIRTVEDSLYVLLGQGGGDFARQTVLLPQGAAATGTVPCPTVAADLDGDGWVDLVLGTAGQQLSFFHGAGGGRFDGPETLAIPVTFLVAADVDGDGRTDLAAAGQHRIVIDNFWHYRTVVTILRNLR